MASAGLTPSDPSDSRTRVDVAMDILRLFAGVEYPGNDHASHDLSADDAALKRRAIQTLDDFLCGVPAGDDFLARDTSGAEKRRSKVS